jgi:CRISPR/Cas system-associated endonuclease Cas1
VLFHWGFTIPTFCLGFTKKTVLSGKKIMQIFVNTPGTFITQKDACFRLKQKDKRFDISPLKVESIVISNQAVISTQAIILALENNIDTIFMDTYGYPIGRIWFSKMGSTGKPVIVEAMNKHLDESVRYRRKNIKRRHILQHEAHTLANILLSDEPEKRPEWVETKEF